MTERLIIAAIALAITITAYLIDQHARKPKP
jgi:hypothetical protein